jgi:D-lyxose ketol-isomerase
MTVVDEKTFRPHYIDLIHQSGFPLTERELEALEVSDFGLNNLPHEGFAFIDILRSPRLRVTLLVLLPNQSLPQHVHPPYEEEQGKEETIRVLYGQTGVYIKGEATNPDAHIPVGKDSYYTARREIRIGPGEQYTVTPNTEHWFQGGPEGSVNICFQNRVDENKNLFWDPQSFGCPIGPTDP